MDDQKKKRQEWKATFDMLDKDRSGGIGPRELKIGLRGMGFRPTNEEIELIMREHDTDGTGELEFPEFCEIMASKEKESAIGDILGVPQKRQRSGHKKKFRMTEDKVAETRRVFDSFDIDGNGAIDKEELAKALDILGFNKTTAEVEKIMDTYDTNNSGDLSYAEFLTMISAENEELAGMGDRFKAATHNILKELAKTNFTAAAPADMNMDTWDEKPERPPGKPGLKTETTFKSAIVVLGVMQVIMIILFGTTVEMTLVEHDFTNLYIMYGGVVIMMFFGFGYLMTFLKRYGMGSVGFTMMITCIGIQWGILVEGFCRKLYHTESDATWGYIQVNLHTVLESLFVCATVLISYGGVIGKTSPLQLIVMTFIESFFYAVNKVMLCLGVVEFVDAGGTINIHMFGAYFGLAVAWVLGKPTASAEAEGGHVSDLFSLIGTLFLWIYWPSFNAAVLEANGAGQQRGVVNTILALSACTVATFLWSSVLSSTSKFRPVDIQNCTLAGGVAMGAVCDLTLNGSDSLLIGFAAGTVSTFGYNRVQEFLEHKFNIHDTCGINNLHGMPSLVGGAATTILAAIKASKHHDVPSPFIHRDQALDQFISILFTLGMSISSGLVTGYILNLIRPDENITEFYCDEPYWEIMDDFGRSIESNSQKMAKGLEHLQQGLEASATLRQLMSNFHNMEEGGAGYNASDHGDAGFVLPVSNNAGKDRTSSLDRSGH